MNLFTAPETFPFGVAVGMLVGLAIVEGIGAFVAASPSTLMENLLPMKDMDHDGIIDGPLGWLHVGKVPLLVLLILFLSGFALCGYIVQGFARGILGSYVSSWIAAAPAFFMGLTTVHGLGSLIAHIIPKDETWAVSENALIGRAGIVTGGTARSGLAAQVRIRDAHGRAHYLMVEPDLAEEEFPEGTAVLIVKKVGAIYRAIKNPHPDLL